jgi:prepilin-type N-terminal cleavage/methylation domain-containing protein
VETGSALRVRGAGDGFTLVEAVVALALVGVALLLDLGLQARVRQIEARVAAEADLLRRAEAAIESVRSGIHPLATGPVEGDLAWPSPAEPTLAMILVVDPTDAPGLCRVKLHGQSRDVGGRTTSSSRRWCGNRGHLVGDRAAT